MRDLWYMYVIGKKSGSTNGMGLFFMNEDIHLQFIKISQEQAFENHAKLLHHCFKPFTSHFINYISW